MKIPEPARRGWTDVLECVDEVFRTREGKRGWALHGFVDLVDIDKDRCRSVH